MNEVDIIRGAREILSDPKNWFQGGASDGAGAYCVAGAVGVAANCERFSYGAVMRANNAIAARVPGRYGSVVDYNDDPRTTHADILNVLDKTLADLGGLG